MKTGILRVAAAAALLTASAGAARAETGPGSETNGAQIRVINNYVSMVRVYVRDANLRSHDMGLVARAGVEVIQVPPEITELGAYSVEVVPADPVWSHWTEDKGLRTNALTLSAGEALNFWVEPVMGRSTVEIGRG